MSRREKEQSFSTRCTEPARCPVVCELSVVARASGTATASEGAGPGAGRDPRFVTLGPRRGCPTVRGGQRGGGRPPGVVQGAASDTATEGAGPGVG